MRTSLEKVNRFLDAPLDVGPRLLLVLAFLCLVPTYFAPLYNMTMFAPQYHEGLRLDIYSYKLVGGNQGQDVKEINVLNHYIGMRKIDRADQPTRGNQCNCIRMDNSTIMRILTGTSRRCHWPPRWAPRSAACASARKRPSRWRRSGTRCSATR